MFLYTGRKPVGFSVSTEIDFVFVRVVEIDLISMWGIKLYLILVRSEIDLVVWVVEIDLISA